MPRASHAGTLIEQLLSNYQRVTYKKPFSTGSYTLAPTVGATELTASALATWQASGGSGQGGLAYTYSVATYQLYYEQSSSTDMPPTVVYAHENLNDTGGWTYGAIDSSNDGWGVSCTAGVKPATDNPQAAAAATTNGGINGVGNSSGSDVAYNLGKESVSFSNLSWTVAYTLPSGLKVYELNPADLPQITSPTASLIGTASANGTASSTITGTCGFGLSIYFMLTP